MPRMFPSTIVRRSTFDGYSEISTSPSAKKVVKTIPMTTSSRSFVRCFTKAIAPAANKPLMNAPTLNGQPSK